MTTVRVVEAAAASGELLYGVLPLEIAEYRISSPPHLQPRARALIPSLLLKPQVPAMDAGSVDHRHDRRRVFCGQTRASATQRLNVESFSQDAAS